jgi:predicted RNA-binding Zn-ribbon protein involved in translation (DUF1610 family)
MADDVICKTCGFHGSSTTATKGSFLIEVILWLCFLIPGLIYSIWRISSRSDACPKCGSSEVIPIDSPLGRKLMQEIAPTELAAYVAPYRPTTARKGGIAWQIGKLFGSLKK